MKNKSLILLNIYDDKLKYFIHSFCKEHQIKEPSLVPHITLRGPFTLRGETLPKTHYNRTPSLNIYNKLNTYIDDLKCNKEYLEIKGVDYFKNNDTYIIYLKVTSTNKLKSVIYKKDYPKKDGFNPHITIASTKDRNEAMRIIKTLENMNISFHCSNVEWNFHTLSCEKNMLNMAIA